MAYVDPKNVDSPRANWKLIDVLRNGRQDGKGDGDASLAIGSWDDFDGSGPSFVFAIRWNGSTKEKSSVGHPQSRGLPTWFIVPWWMNDAILNSGLIPDGKRALVDALLASNK